MCGNDLSPFQPSGVPPNVKFEIDDFEQDWPYEEGTFDLVHARTLSRSVADWGRCIERLFVRSRWWGLGGAGTWVYVRGLWGRRLTCG
jgi:hypothetical protein